MCVKGFVEDCNEPKDFLVVLLPGKGTLPVWQIGISHSTELGT